MTTKAIKTQLPFVKGTTFKADTKKGVKATLIIINTWGLPIVRNVWLKRVEVKNKDSYCTWRNAEQAVSAWYTIKGKRKTTGTKFTGGVTIALGWQDIEGAFNNTPNSEFLSFENGKLEELSALAKDVLISSLG